MNIVLRFFDHIAVLLFGEERAEVGEETSLHLCGRRTVTDEVRHVLEITDCTVVFVFCVFK